MSIEGVKSALLVASDKCDAMIGALNGVKQEIEFSRGIVSTAIEGTNNLQLHDALAALSALDSVNDDHIQRVQMAKQALDNAVGSV